ncbi:MAG: transcription antitermination factor NusB [Candidatus Pacebacteria bacterium]|nr:transcription antitermination factor NusB [Candidatus Paceibacterota bacterium]
MSNRHLARSIVLQTLFELDFTKRNPSDFSSVLSRMVAESGADGVDHVFMDKLGKGTLSRQKDLDTIIEKDAPDWPIDRIAPIDKAILRLGLHELLFGDRADVPPKVAINEAIELAKSFGGDASGKFVNGVLGSVYKEIGEPGKNETSKKKKDIPYDQLPVERLGGAVVYAIAEGDVYVALVHDVFGHWTLSKGHIEESESVPDGIKRKLKEELGLDLSIEDELGSNEYVASHPENGKIRKNVTYHLAKAPFTDITLGTSGGLDDARWFKLAEIVSLNIYDDILPLITKAINALLAK